MDARRTTRSKENTAFVPHPPLGFGLGTTVIDCQYRPVPTGQIGPTGVQLAWVSQPVSAKGHIKEDVMPAWKDIAWVPVCGYLPTAKDGASLADGAKVAVYVTTAQALLEGSRELEIRGYHLAKHQFDDDSTDEQRVILWAPCFDVAGETLYSDHAEKGG